MKLYGHGEVRRLLRVDDPKDYFGFSLKGDGIWLHPPEDKRHRYDYREHDHLYNNGEPIAIPSQPGPFENHDYSKPVLPFPCTRGQLRLFLKTSGLDSMLDPDNEVLVENLSANEEDQRTTEMLPNGILTTQNREEEQYIDTAKSNSRSACHLLPRDASKGVALKYIYLSPQEAAEQLKINLRSLLKQIIIGKLLLYYPEDLYGGPLFPITQKSVKAFFDNPEMAIAGSELYSECSLLGTCPRTRFNNFPQEEMEKLDLTIKMQWAKDYHSFECKRRRDCGFPSGKPEVEIFIEGDDDMIALPAVKLSDLIIKQEDVDALLNENKEQTEGKNIAAQKLAGDRHAGENERINGIAEIIMCRINEELKRIRDDKNQCNPLEIKINHIGFWNEAAEKHNLNKDDRDRVLNIVKTDAHYKGIFKFYPGRPYPKTPLIVFK